MKRNLKPTFTESNLGKPDSAGSLMRRENTQPEQLAETPLRRPTFQVRVRQNKPESEGSLETLIQMKGLAKVETQTSPLRPNPQLSLP